jgi:hypothetical protein
MSRQAQSVHWDSWDLEKIHRDKVTAKLDRIAGLKALIETWEARDDADHQYILELRAKLRSAVNQYEAFSL